MLNDGVAKNEVEPLVLERHRVRIPHDNLEAVIFVRTVDIQTYPFGGFELRKTQQALFRGNGSDLEDSTLPQFRNDLPIGPIHLFVHVAVYPVAAEFAQAVSHGNLFSFSSREFPVMSKS
jgi:hypothetical protein